jgi:lysine-specific demethylase 3
MILYLARTDPLAGPKMYNAQATSDKKGSHGSTKLHMDMSDALNIMTSASDTVAGGPGYAIWDIFRAGDATAIRTFMRSKFSVRDTLDPIHTQQWYLDTDTLAELFVKTGIKSHRIFQLPGQAVFVPAGCAHQVWFLLTNLGNIRNSCGSR